MVYFVVLIPQTGWRLPGDDFATMGGTDFVVCLHYFDKMNQADSHLCRLILCLPYSGIGFYFDPSNPILNLYC